jgi:glutathionylspermidine synthase
MAVDIRDRQLAAQMAPLRAASPLDAARQIVVRRRAIFECCKWDPQVGDTSSLCPFPLVIRKSVWSQLAGWAEQLAAEALAAEQEILKRPALLARLGLPRAIVNALSRASKRGIPSSISRVIRFDFHLCREGWRISEANTDVPGGFIEAAGFTHLMVEHYDDLRPAGDPAAVYADQLANGTNPGSTLALVHATAYTDDRQVMTYLARQFESRGLKTCLASPADLRWKAGHASLVTPEGIQPLTAIVRFFPGEWLPNLPNHSEWTWLLAGSQTPLSNPAAALVSQSKRFPLVWDDLATSLETWRSLLPETRSPTEVDWRRDGWVLKPALGRVGDGIGLRGVTAEKQWRKLARAAFWHPADWVAQRRFDAVPVATSNGAIYPVLGVYTIGGRAAGIYGRLAARPLIDHQAQDVAVLVEEDNACH